MSSNWKDAPTLIEDVKGEISAYCYAVKRQYGRIFDSEKEVGREYSAEEFSPIIEFHFLVTALWRVRCLLGVLQQTGRCGQAAATLAEFKKLLPDLQEFRDTFEHFDERVKGRKQKDMPIKLARMRSWAFVDDCVWLDAGVVQPESDGSVGRLNRKHLRLNRSAVDQGIDRVLVFIATL